MDIDEEVDIWYQVEGRASALIEGFTGQFVNALLEEIVVKEKLQVAASTLQPFVKKQNSDEKKSLRELEDELCRGQTLNFKDLVTKHDIWRRNPIIVRLPGTLLSSRHFIHDYYHSIPLLNHTKSTFLAHLPSIPPAGTSGE